MDKDLKKKDMEIILNVCKELNLQVFLDAGLLLGAIREKDFIANDSDFDFGRLQRMAIFLFKDGKSFIVEPLVFREITDSDYDLKPTFESRSPQEMEEFFRSFVKCAEESMGIRSKGESKLKGLLEAKEAHLQDLRALVTIPENLGKTLVRP